MEICSLLSYYNVLYQTELKFSNSLKYLAFFSESSKDKKLEYTDKTNKILNMQRVFLKNKPASDLEPTKIKETGKETEDLENKNSHARSSNDISEPKDSRTEQMDTTYEQTKHSRSETTDETVKLVEGGPQCKTHKDTQAVSDTPSVKKFKGDHALSNEKKKT